MSQYKVLLNRQRPVRLSLDFSLNSTCLKTNIVLVKTYRMVSRGYLKNVGLWNDPHDIQPLQVIGQRLGLSFLDIMTINAHYECCMCVCDLEVMGKTVLQLCGKLQKLPAATSSNQQQPAAISSNQQRPEATDSNHQQPAASSSKQQQAAATSSNRKQPAATSNNQQQAAATSSNRDWTVFNIIKPVIELFLTQQNPWLNCF